MRSAARTSALPANGERLRALLQLAMRASGAVGGALRVQDAAGTELRLGRTTGAFKMLAVEGLDGKFLARLDLFGAGDVNGIAVTIAPLLEALLVRRARGRTVDEMRRRMEDLERELHHRSGNILQSVASFMRMQAEEFDSRSDATLEEARALMEDARLRVLVVGAVQAAIEIGADDEGGTETSIALAVLCERLEGILPGRIAFRTDLAELTVDRDHASALGIMVSEFAIAAIRDAFPKQASNSVHLRTTAYVEDGREHISMILHHEAEGYDTASWMHGSPVLTGRIVESVATQMDGLVAIDRADESDGFGDEAVRGMRLRLVFDRPNRATAMSEPWEEEAGDGAHLPEPPRTFDNRLGIQAGHATMRKS